MLEICVECYPMFFPVYPNMKIQTSNKKHKCAGCGKLRKVVRRVTVGKEVIDLN